MLNPHSIKKLFPIFRTKVRGKSLVYLDNASTTQKPKVVIDALKNYYENFNSNIHRGIHTLSEKATQAYESCRKRVAGFINAKSEKEIIFTRNTTEAINLAAYSWGNLHVKKNDEIIVSAIEHHSNLVPWQQLCHRKNAKLKVINLKTAPTNDPTYDYTLDMNHYSSLLSKKTKLVAITGMSNVLGVVPDLHAIIKQAHKVGALTMVDGAQSIAHMPTDVQKLNCDFLAFSAHKMLGPTGVGILYCKEEILKNMPPFLYGGDMVKTVGQFDATWNDLPWKFEAGTPNIADVIAFEKAIEFIEKIGFNNIATHDQKLFNYAKKMFAKYPQVKLHCPPGAAKSACANPSSIISFSIKGVHPHDIAQIFDDEAVAIRSGHHCNQPLMERLGVPATARLSFYIYNTIEDIDRVEIALKNTLKTFKNV